jgi:hypothetical protein
MVEGRDIGPWQSGGQPNGPPDPSRMRVGDRERHAVAEVLREAAGEGRIDMAELDERLEATYAAKTYADLVPITADLPVSHRPDAALIPRPVAQPPAYGPTYASSVAVMSETKRSGPWQVGATHAAFALMGSVVLDLRQAQFAVPEILINANAVMAGVEVIVDAHTHVLVEGTGVMGEFKEAKPKVPYEPRPHAPVVRVRGIALMGSVEVKRLPPPGTPKRRKLLG